MGYFHRRFGGRKGIWPVKRFAPIIPSIVTSISLPSLDLLNELILENEGAGLVVWLE